MDASVFSRPQIMPIIEESTDGFTLFDCKWIPSSARFLVMGSHIKGHGLMRIYAMDSANSIRMETEAERPDPIKCATFGASSLEDRHLATGDFQGTLAVWDTEILNHGPIYCVKGHEQIINAIDGVGGLGVGAGAPEIVTASRDGNAKVWDLRTKDRPVACMQPKVDDGTKPRDCWSVAFGDSFSETERKVVAGYDNGDVKMFDLRTMSVFWETQLPNGVCGLSFDRKDIEMNKLLATCLEGKIHMFDLRTFHKEQGFAGLSHRVEKGHTIWGGKFLPQNRDVFATMGGSGTITLHKYEYPDKRRRKLEDDTHVGVEGKIVKLNDGLLGDQPVSGFDWHPDKTGLAVSTSFDQKIRVVVVTKLNTL